jgi:hypothetical protein
VDKSRVRTRSIASSNPSVQLKDRAVGPAQAGPDGDRR